MTEYDKAIAKWKNEMAEKGWIGVDLDATLAVHGKWHGPLHVGDPIPAMIERVKRWLAAGHRVKIFTARASEPDPDLRTAMLQVVESWCEKHLGQRLEITNVKDYAMIELWDDRAIQVIPNTGIRADGKE